MQPKADAAKADAVKRLQKKLDSMTEISEESEAIQKEIEEAKKSPKEKKADEYKAVKAVKAHADIAVYKSRKIKSGFLTFLGVNK
jgi:hypothetical protein